MKNPEEPLSIVMDKGLCCVCDQAMNRGKTVNMVSLRKMATWNYPTHGNILIGTHGMALAIVCDHCVVLDEHNNMTALKNEPTKAIELTADNKIIYHPVTELADA